MSVCVLRWTSDTSRVFLGLLPGESSGTHFQTGFKTRVADFFHYFLEAISKYIWHYTQFCTVTWEKFQYLNIGLYTYLCVTGPLNHNLHWSTRADRAHTQSNVIGLLCCCVKERQKSPLSNLWFWSWMERREDALHPDNSGFVCSACASNWAVLLVRINPRLSYPQSLP